MCGIFGFLNFDSEVSRVEMLKILLRGLRRLEYRGYDSAGVAFDSVNGPHEIEIVKTNGNVQKLIDLIHAKGYLPTNKIEESADNNNKADEDAEFSPELMVNNHVAIAHTRWATHGEPSPINSHPHRSEATNAFVIVHNGMITNYDALKGTLEAQGYRFESATDTEVFAKLCHYIYEQQRVDAEGKPQKVSLVEIVRVAASQIEGTYAFLVKSRLFPGELVAARMGSPLIVGMAGQEFETDDEEHTIPLSARMTDRKSTAYIGGEMARRTSPVLYQDGHRNSSVLVAADGVSRRAKMFFLSSDAAAIIEHTRAVIYMEDKDLVHIRNGKLSIYNTDVVTAAEATRQNRILHKLKGQIDAIMKGNYDHFMQKEIFEQKDSIMNTMRGRVKFDGFDVRLGGVLNNLKDVITSRRIYFLACGSSYNSCLAARQIFEELSGLPVAVELASEFVDRKPNVFRDEVYVFVSQSGETADTLRALRYVKTRGAITCGITNTVGSAIARETEFGVHVNAGIEIGVASTKAYTSQVVSIILFALQLSSDSKGKQDRRSAIIADLRRLPELIESTLKSTEPLIKQLAEDLKRSTSIMVFGRGYNYATALEGALKIKEISYVHSEGVSAAELKHGTIALIDEKMPCMLIATQDELLPNVMSALEQLSARHGRVIAVCSEGESFDAIKRKATDIIQVPKVVDCLSPVINVIPFQLLSYHLALSLGHNVDQPRNLAKSVVV
jgi:glucosamine--fructose-6-phosphate aminotransferase (isomerizing)